MVLVAPSPRVHPHLSLKEPIQHVQRKPQALRSSVEMEEGMPASSDHNRHRILAALAADLNYELSLGLGAEATFRWIDGDVLAVTGWNKEGLLAKGGIDPLVLPEDHAAFTSHRAALTHGTDNICTYRITTRSGEVRWLEDRARQIQDGRGASFVLGILRDVTAAKQHEAELIRAHREAEEMNRLKSAFLANMSHEIRTPLAAIIGFSSILMEEVPRKHRRFISFIERSGKRLLETLNSILNLSMLESGSVKLNREVLNVVHEVGEKVTMMRALAEDKGLTLEMQTDATEVQAFLDRVCLDRILTNLVSNAIKFTEEGQVSVSVFEEADRAIVRVRDTGVGISKKFLPHIFGDFKQESMGEARAYEGVGLGLAITKRMVQLMGGEINVHTAKGQGSTFTVSFPQLVVVQRPTTPIADDALETPAVPQKARILAVEDNPDMLVLLKHYLGKSYDVVTAADEEAAMDYVTHEQFDLLMMDIHLGRERTGVDVLADVRRVDGYADTPVIAVTAYALPGDRERFLASGFDGYIGKPFTRKQLYAVLETVLAT